MDLYCFARRLSALPWPPTALDTKMADIYDMTRRATMHGIEGDVKALLAEADDASSRAAKQSQIVRALPISICSEKIGLERIVVRYWHRHLFQTIDKLPDKVLQQIFSYLSPYQASDCPHSYILLGHFLLFLFSSSPVADPAVRTSLQAMAKRSMQSNVVEIRVLQAKLRWNSG